MEVVFLISLAKDFPYIAAVAFILFVWFKYRRKKKGEKMSEEEKKEQTSAVKVEVEIEDAVIVASLKVDVVKALEELSKKTDNTIDDGLVALVASARDNLDWKGKAKELL